MDCEKEKSEEAKNRIPSERNVTLPSFANTPLLHTAKTHYGIVYVDRHRNLLSASGKIRELFGEDLHCGKCHRYFYEMDNACHNCPAQRTFDKGEVTSFEKKIKTRDGIEKVFEITSKVSEYDEKGTPLVILQLIIEKGSEERDHNRTIFELAPDAMLLTNKETGIILDVNKAAEKLLKKEKNEIIGLHQSAIHPPDANARKLFREMKAKLESGEEAWTVIDVLRSDSSICKVEIRSYIVDLGGEEVVLGVFRDISKRIEYESDLEKQKKLLNILIDSLPLAVFLKTPEGKIVLMNHYCEKQFGISFDKLSGTNGRSIFSPAQMSSLRKKDMEAFENGQILATPEEELNDANSDKHIYRTWRIPLFDNTGNPYMLLSVMEDITEHKKTENDIILKNTAIESSINAIAFSDMNGVLTYVNNSLLKMWGYESADELIGKKGEELGYNKEQAEKIKQELIETGSWIGETESIAKNGSVFATQLSCSLVKNSDGNPVAMMGSFVDISDKKHVEAELLEAREETEYANRAKSNFLANINHEIRTPMNGILGMIELLNETPLTEDQQECIEVIRSSGKNLLQIVSDILDISTIEAGKIKLYEENFNIFKTLEDIEKEIKPDAKHKDITVSISFMNEISSVLMGDYARTKQILLNIINNAIKFTAQGGKVEISICRTDITDTTETILFIVKDTGIGIAEDKRDFIFAPFTQIDSSSTREHGGSGLGLSICRNLVRKMGGNIWVESTEGEGSQFYLDIPFRRLASPNTDRAKKQNTKKSILIGGNNKSPDLKFFARNFSLKNFSISIIPSETEMINIYRKAPENIDIIMLDLDSPNIDPYSTATAIRNYEKNNNKRPKLIIAVTSPGINKEKCISAGIDDCIMKPVTQQGFANLVEKWQPSSPETN